MSAAERARIGHSVSLCHIQWLCGVITQPKALLGACLHSLDGLLLLARGRARSYSVCSTDELAVARR
jgi:hypothetical protein